MSRSVGVVILALTTASCATLFNGTSQRVEVVSEPPGATVYVDGAEVGITPTEVVLSRRSREREFRVVAPSGDSLQRWVRPRPSDRLWLNVFSGLFFGSWAWSRSAEDALEGNIGVGIMGFIAPWVVDIGLGGTHQFPDRLDFSSRSALRQQPLLQQAMRTVQPGRHVPLRDVELRGGLRIRALLDVPQLNHLAEGGREVVDRGEEEVP